MQVADEQSEGKKKTVRGAQEESWSAAREWAPCFILWMSVYFQIIINRVVSASRIFTQLILVHRLIIDIVRACSSLRDCNDSSHQIHWENESLLVLRKNGWLCLV